MRFLITFAVAAIFALADVASAASARIDLGLLAGADVHLPRGPALGVAFVISDMAGVGAAEGRLATALGARGYAVLSIDLPHYLKVIEASKAACSYLVADIERVSQQVGRETGSDMFRAPVVAGSGAGGALVLDMLAQTPPATLGGVVAVDPAGMLALKQPLCTPARRETIPPAASIAGGGSSGGRGAWGARYVLPAGTPQAPLTVIETAAASTEGRARIQALADGGVNFYRREAASSAEQALADGLLAALGAVAAPESTLAELPLAELPATPSRDALAIVISGDGGWRDLDRSVAGALQAKGVPTIGLDALRYFWRSRTPEETARDLASIIQTYAARWRVSHVILIGYSFGADVLPAVYLALPPQVREKVALIALLGVDIRADWEISVAGWLGRHNDHGTPIMPAIDAIPPSLVQCFYGRDETDTICPQLAARGVEVIVTPGGHHFDGDYAALAEHILTGLDGRLRARFPGAAPGQASPP